MLTSVVNYGGRINDDKDMRTADIIIADFLTPEIFAESYEFRGAGIYKTIETDCQRGYLDYIDSFPQMPEPEVFGMHGNAMITYDLVNESARATARSSTIVEYELRIPVVVGLPVEEASSREVMGLARPKDMEARLAAPSSIRTTCICGILRIITECPTRRSSAGGDQSLRGSKR